MSIDTSLIKTLLNIASDVTAYDAEVSMLLAAAQADMKARGVPDYLLAGYVAEEFTADGSTTAFTLSATPSAVIAVYLDGVAATSYTRAGSTVTFTTAPTAGVTVVIVSDTGAYDQRVILAAAAYCKAYFGNDRTDTAEYERILHSLLFRLGLEYGGAYDA